MNKQIIVTQDGMTQSQPGICVAYISSSNETGCELMVFRNRDKIRNRFGGLGVAQNCDCNGMWFQSIDHAKKFAISRGYLKPFYRNKSK